MSADAEMTETFACFGSTCSALVTGSRRDGSAGEAAAMVKQTLLAWHARFSRFLPDSELSRLNGDPRRVVPVSALMARLAQAIVTAGSLTGGLVDGTLVEKIEGAGYVRHLREPLALADALALAPSRKPAACAASPGWRQVEVDLARHTIRRSPAVKLDSGGLAKGLFADTLAGKLADHGSFAVNCAGDVALGGTASTKRPVHVESPFDGRILHTFELAHGGVATSGIGRRSWLGASGAPAHHLLDPSTGEPAYTGIVQVTALARTALLAEIRAKAAILSGPRRAASWLPDGGLVVFDDGSHTVIARPPVLTLSQLSAYGPRSRTPSTPTERVLIAAASRREAASGPDQASGAPAVRGAGAAPR
ncbi:MAG TPA: FAD:protein FMN transferase [Solirubrobacteraceae bacterium]|nr:FAD:protein FMN transferase [Solirubrobacteraceae bacterium]